MHKATEEELLTHPQTHPVPLTVLRAAPKPPEGSSNRSNNEIPNQSIALRATDKKQSRQRKVSFVIIAATAAPLYPPEPI